MAVSDKRRSAAPPNDVPTKPQMQSRASKNSDGSKSSHQPEAAPPGRSREREQPSRSRSGRNQRDGRPGGIQRAATEIGEIKDKITDKKRKIRDKTKPPGGFDPTPLPHVPPGYTIKITFHKATNLPAADIKTSSADPYIHATLTADVPKRHTNDPALTHRTRTISRSTEPEWEEEWIVANVPSSGFRLKCRLYDEDATDHDDRLGNVTIRVPHIDEGWNGLGPTGRVFDVKKRAGSKRAYFFKAIHSGIRHNVTMTPHLHLGISVLGRSDPPGGHMYTVGPTRWIKHFSPMIGRLAGTKVNKDEKDDRTASTHAEDRSVKKFDFQANEIQLEGPVPPNLYHRYVEFRPVIGMMFTSHGVRGRVLNKALHKQHNRIYNFNSSTEYGTFEPCSREASLQLLKMAHFDEGGRIFTYVLTLDGLLRFTETGKEFGIDLLSKHTMHSDVATYIACSGEFFIRRLAHRAPASEKDEPDPHQPTHPDQDVPGGPPGESPPRDPAHYQLVIDNNSGTYRPDKGVLPDLKAFLERNLPGLGIVVMHCMDQELDKLKEAQLRVKDREGKNVNMVLNRSPSASSLSSDDVSRLGELEAGGGGKRRAVKSKKERAWDVLENPNRLKDVLDGKDIGGEKADEKDKPRGVEEMPREGESPVAAEAIA